MSSWVKISTTMRNHRKIVECDDGTEINVPFDLAAYGLIVAMIAESRQLMSDGSLTYNQIRRLFPTIEGEALTEVIHRLVENSSLEQIDDKTYHIRNFAEYQQTSDEVDELSKKRARAGAKGGKTKAENEQVKDSVVVKPKQTSSKLLSKTLANDKQTSSKVLAEKRREEESREEEEQPRAKEIKTSNPHFDFSSDLPRERDLLGLLMEKASEKFDCTEAEVRKHLKHHSKEDKRAICHWLNGRIERIQSKSVFLRSLADPITPKDREAPKIGTWQLPTMNACEKCGEALETPLFILSTAATRDENHQTPVRAKATTAYNQDYQVESWASVQGICNNRNCESTGICQHVDPKEHK